jgi:hypothetical protein
MTTFISLTSPMPDGPDAQVTLNIADIIIFGEPDERISREHPRANATIRIREYPHAIPVLESPATIHALIYEALRSWPPLVKPGVIDVHKIDIKPEGIMHLPTSSAITEEFKRALFNAISAKLLAVDGFTYDLTTAICDAVLDLLMDYEQTAPADTTPEPPEGFSDWFNQTFMPACTSLGHTSTSFCEAFGASPVEYFHICKRCDAKQQDSTSYALTVSYEYARFCMYRYEGIWLPDEGSADLYHPEATKERRYG